MAMHRNEVRIHIRRLRTLIHEAKNARSVWRIYLIHREMRSILRILKTEAPETYQYIKDNSGLSPTLFR